jgi:hypothetical protein
MNNKISDYVVVIGTEGFTDIQTGEVFDVAEMLTLFTAAELAQVRLSSVLVRPLLRQPPVRDPWGELTPVERRRSPLLCQLDARRQIAGGL